MTIVIIIMVVAALLVAVWPLLRPSPAPISSRTSFREKLPSLLETKESLYEAIKELEFDRQAEKLSEEDFKVLTGVYRERALAVLRQIDEAEKLEVREEPNNLELELEREISALRGVPHEGKGGEKGLPETALCSGCGSPLSEDDRFCSSCGKRVQGEGEAS